MTVGGQAQTTKIMHQTHNRHFDRREKSRGAHALTREWREADAGFLARQRRGMTITKWRLDHRAQDSVDRLQLAEGVDYLGAVDAQGFAHGPSEAEVDPAGLFLKRVGHRGE